MNNSSPSYGAGVLGLTDGASAARNLLPTALLCDASGTACVGADNASLQAAAATFTPSSTAPQFMQPPAQPSITDGAYPLALPIYAEINTKGLSSSDASGYARILTYIAGDGQVQGYDIGDLPPGLAPLTDSLKAQTAAAITTLQAMSTPTSTPKPTKTAKPTPTPTPSPSHSAAVPPVNPVEPPQPPSAPIVTQKPQPVVTSTPTPQPSVVAIQGITPAAAIGPLPGLALAGLIGALVAGIAAPIIGRPRKARA